VSAVQVIISARGMTVSRSYKDELTRKLAKLEPALVCFGHGPPLRDTKKFTDFVAGLPGA